MKRLLLRSIKSQHLQHLQPPIRLNKPFRNSSLPVSFQCCLSLHQQSKHIKKSVQQATHHAVRNQHHHPRGSLPLRNSQSPSTASSNIRKPNSATLYPMIHRLIQERSLYAPTATPLLVPQAALLQPGAPAPPSLSPATKPLVKGSTQLQTLSEIPTATHVPA